MDWNTEREAICKTIGVHPGSPALIEVIQRLYAYAQGWSILVEAGLVDDQQPPLIAANRLVRQRHERPTDSQ